MKELRKTFNNELNKMHVRFAEMGMMTHEAIFRSVKAFVDHDKELSREVIARDQAINECENELEKMTLEVIALYQPVTADLRDVITILKASSDIERIGDHAVSICHATIKMKGSQRIAAVEVEIAKMGDYTCSMVEQVLDAYVNRDLEAAYKLAKEDRFLDQELKKIRSLCMKVMQQEPDAVFSGSYYISIATYLERIGDYVTNVCEWIVFLQLGEIVELNPSARNEL
ncbi:phosphate transporter PhoU [Liquorilactobacillus satsumensis DSM 16230 = JCM 12392]|uniref:Phosphate-specific transport system accessory protein PhoU n=1 Tax=Liquorilactobacillus satsumensis DSM 16230 = JCM 12392 TaxID=1423801 RepID=A0A0R1V3K9_9LACO|nr:phosphate transporter PhoU [Liquorilactobacillus satsumensis DSM 16230 = JCM 12392]